jgi:catechol 2,3-dioxygenase-like lactoylglutathione lyase family enzyme
MIALAIHHVQLAMPPAREAEARAFYQGLLGIPEVPKPPPLAARGGCWFELGAVRIHLGVEADFRPARKAHPALIVEDLTVLTSALTRAGFPIRTDEVIDGFTRVYVDDPFGNRIELMEPRSRQRDGPPPG